MASSFPGAVLRSSGVDRPSVRCSGERYAGSPLRRPLSVAPREGHGALVAVTRCQRDVLVVVAAVSGLRGLAAVVDVIDQSFQPAKSLSSTKYSRHCLFPLAAAGAAVIDYEIDSSREGVLTYTAE